MLDAKQVLKEELDNLREVIRQAGADAASVKILQGQKRILKAENARLYNRVDELIQNNDNISKELVMSQLAVSRLMREKVELQETIKKLTRRPQIWTNDGEL